MTKQELKRKHPEEQLLMFDCPNCGQEVNRKFVEKIIDDIEQAVREEMIKIAEKIIDDYCWIDNNQQIIYKDIFLKEFKKLLTNSYDQKRNNSKN